MIFAKIRWRVYWAERCCSTSQWCCALAARGPAPELGTKVRLSCGSCLHYTAHSTATSGVPRGHTPNFVIAVALLISQFYTGHCQFTCCFFAHFSITFTFNWNRTPLLNSGNKTFEISTLFIIKKKLQNKNSAPVYLTCRMWRYMVHLC